MKRSLYLLYILTLMIVLIPKESLYYTLEAALEKEHIYFSHEAFNNVGLYLDVDAIDVVLDAISVASIERIRISPWIITNRLSLSSLSVSPNYKLFFPGKIEEIELSYSLWNPLNIQIKGYGDFGECEGYFNIVDQKMRVVFEITPQLRNYPLLISKLHKEEGGLVYESNF